MGATPQSGTVTRLDVLKDAREIAVRVGIVETGLNFFEVQNGERHGVGPSALRLGEIQPEQVCGVCIAGACALADILAGGEGDPWEFVEDAQGAAYEVLSRKEHSMYEGVVLTEAIEDKGLPYVLAVLDRMVELEAAAA